MENLTIHWAFQFCETIETANDPDETLWQTVARVCADGSISRDALLKSRDDLRNLATLIERAIGDGEVG